MENLAVKYFCGKHWKLLSLQFLDLLNLHVICQKQHYTDLSRKWTQWLIKIGSYINQTEFISDRLWNDQSPFLIRLTENLYFSQQFIWIVARNIQCILYYTNSINNITVHVKLKCPQHSCVSYMKHIWKQIIQLMNDTEITEIKFNKILSETNIDLDRFWTYCLADIVNLKHWDISWWSQIITLIPNI